MKKKTYENKMMTFENTSDVEIHGLKPGKEIKIECDQNGIPLEKIWRRRLKDGDCLTLKKKGE